LVNELESASGEIITRTAASDEIYRGYELGGYYRVEIELQAFMRIGEPTLTGSYQKAVSSELSDLIKASTRVLTLYGVAWGGALFFLR
jgi:hypothetical protein